MGNLVRFSYQPTYNSQAGYYQQVAKRKATELIIDHGQLGNQNPTQNCFLIPSYHPSLGAGSRQPREGEREAPKVGRSQVQAKTPKGRPSSTQGIFFPQFHVELYVTVVSTCGAPMSRCDVGVPPTELQKPHAGARSPWPPSLFYLFSCLYVVAALIIVEVLLELLEIVLTTIRLEEQQLLDGPRHKRRRQEGSLFHIFWYFQCFFSLSLLLYELVDSVSAHTPVHPYREYPFCAFIL